MTQTHDVRIKAQPIKLPKPKQILAEPGLVLSEELKLQVIRHRQVIGDILTGKDKRLLIVLGPCSIHDEAGALRYADWVVLMQEKFPNLFLVMRAMFEKPRTNLGWKGLMRQPNIIGPSDIPAGIRKCRAIALKLLAKGLPIATETLSTIIPQYFNDLLSYATIGARSVTNTEHREIASIHSMPVGLKNPTSGNIKDAVDAVTVAIAEHDEVLGIDEDGDAAQFLGSGNLFPHVVLRGGENGPNYGREHVEEVVRLLQKAGLPDGIVIDASHGNTQLPDGSGGFKKDYMRQVQVCLTVADMRKHGEHHARGVMIESYNKGGNQKITDDLSKLDPDVSVTDPCIPSNITENILSDL